MLSVSYAGKNAYSASKTSGVLRGGASGVNRGYLLAHRWGGVCKWRACVQKISPLVSKLLVLVPELEILIFKIGHFGLWRTVKIKPRDTKR